MRLSKPMSFRFPAVWICVLLACLIAACGGGDGRGTLPTAPAAPTAPPAATTPNPNAWYWGTATIVSSTPSSCGAFSLPSLQGWYWALELHGSEFTLTQDWSEGPLYRGTLTDRSFDVSLTYTPDPARSACDFGSATISGTFAEDWSSFEAEEMLVWGQPGDEMRAVLRWRGLRG